ncbi:hypothetical protein M1K46_02820 [Fictibacillus sp. WQ 8-8]|uniref:hypothetical protein n=1 Tax=Fictibacillus sp. WQ 8-8 TaxID=2938788 RepID=UPI002108BCF9|nr:hypothetical protein [Fictibacillus sp. WQ 8-8]MCQ6264600.1 hypothetical protein [Fictibacillus sp. WQ 8-8]
MSIFVRQKKTLTVLALLLFTIAGSAWYYISTTSVTEQVEASGTGQASAESYSTIISSYHQYYNRTLCFDADNHINWNDQQEHARQLVSRIETLQVKNENVERDLQNAKHLAQDVAASKDRTALLYLHRIFHDLDKAVNHYKQKDSFGYTYTGTGKRWFGGGVNKVEGYIAKN